LPQINGYKAELSLLFQNLIGNALKFCKEGIPLHIKITAQSKSDYWEFMIQDNGISIEAQYHEKIFLIFQLLHHRETYKGTGIGLAHCQEIVELHSCRIWVESEIDAGRRLYFTILK